MHNAYRGGTPDVWYSGNGGDLWVEYKWVAKLPKKWKPPELSALQKDWLDRRYEEGRAVMVVLGHSGGAVTYESPTQWEDGTPNRLTDAQGVASLIAMVCG